MAPDGERVVSAENLNVTRKPQIAINANASYGLGWMVTSYHGQPVITHAGNTLGFTSEFTFLPEADLGVIVLTNARASNLFNGNVTTKVLELVFEQEPHVEQELDFIVQQIAAAGTAKCRPRWATVSTRRPCSPSWVRTPTPCWAMPSCHCRMASCCWM